MPHDESPLEIEKLDLDPRSLTLLKKNAHFMKERDFNQLVKNLKRDKVLLGSVVTHVKDGKELVLSGNHRVQASIAAGLDAISVIRIVSPIDDARAIAIQISQNAIVGDDDPNILRELYEMLDVLEQQYSGLTDDDLGILDDPDFDKLRLGPPKYEEILLAFLPEDAEEFERELTRILEKVKASKTYKLKFEEYQRFFEVMLKTKDVKGITNDAVSVVAMVELAAERLEQLDETEDSDVE